MTTATLLQARPAAAHDPEGGPGAPSTQPKAHTTTSFDGGTQVVTTAQLAMAWSLFSSGAITKRGLRITFAAHEMLARRRFGSFDTPEFALEEIKRLVGGRGSRSADAALRADIRALARTGLVVIAPKAIAFAKTPDDLAEEHRDEAAAMIETLDHKRRQVPVPRRMLRALAAGFGLAVTAVILAKLIRGCFWDRKRASYRIDGRTKASWIAERFGISQSAAEKARTHLIELGWLEELPTHQIMLNRWGTHDLIVPTWSPDSPQGGSATPSADFAPASATPRKQRALPQEEEPNNRKLSGAQRREPPGFSHENSSGSRKKVQRRRQAPLPKPNLRDIRREDLEETDRLAELHAQALRIGVAKDGEWGQLEFFALAERVRTRATINPGGMFWRLLADQKWCFITQADEDAARRRQKVLLHGETERPERGGGGEGAPAPLTLEERKVQAILRAAPDPEQQQRAARRYLGFAPDEWAHAVLAFRTRHCRPLSDTAVPLGAAVASLAGENA